MITGYLVRIVIAFAVVAVFLYDAGSIAVNFFSLDSKAEEIAVSVATRLTNDELDSTNAKAVELAAQEIADEADAHLVSAVLDPEGVVHIRLRRTANTLIVGRIPPLEDWTKATADGRAGSS
jgi:hypothetical protein